MSEPQQIDRLIVLVLETILEFHVATVVGKNFRQGEFDAKATAIQEIMEEDDGSLPPGHAEVGAAMCALLRARTNGELGACDEELKRVWSIHFPEALQ